jgi:D-arabinose 1-dehydrogenase-like Zn-dependent alcohol dehydrogenase
VAVLGIGGLGHLAVQYAKAAGFETIAISHSPDKDKMIREMGADELSATERLCLRKTPSDLGKASPVLCSAVRREHRQKIVDRQAAIPSS